MEFKGTPAPWVAVINTDLDLPSGLIKSGDKSIAHTLQKAIGAKQARANAHLIAATPELLEVLIECKKWVLCKELQDKADLAIKKALGEEK